MSSVVTPSDSARHLPPMPVVGCDSGVRQCPDSPQQAFGTLHIRPAFPRFPAPRKARLSANAPPLSSVCVCVASAPYAFRISRAHSACAQTNQPKLWSRRALTTTPVVLTPMKDRSLMGVFLVVDGSTQLPSTADIDRPMMGESTPIVERWAGP
ncbi:hypothetical protein PGT21_008451 [Puccinia graminis f. sp. tritici]|uniref:Uncharacterized protein n=1 Tax=Puccinia graminis f. sp. tritici TaxID=56615 RepID=A0A5B0N053_PUCGR|nr:hypothetical protein PGT21_008451 [Puccinia graminis f. sp. tritici]